MTRSGLTLIEVFAREEPAMATPSTNPSRCLNSDKRIEVTVVVERDRAVGCPCCGKVLKVRPVRWNWHANRPSPHGNPTAVLPPHNKPAA